MLIRGAPGSGPALIELHRRLRWAIIFVGVAFMILVGRLWQLQIVRGEAYYERTRKNIVKQRYISSVRGKILDRNGESLAINRAAFNIYAWPKRFKKEQQRELIQLLGLTEEEQKGMRERLAVGMKRNGNEFVMILEDQPVDRAHVVEQESYRLRGVLVRAQAYRFYPNGSLAAHLIGYMNKMNAAEVAKYVPKGSDGNELIGREGLERMWENYLVGKRGIERYVVNAKGRRVTGPEVNGLIDGPKFESPVAGHNLVLTIDIGLQKLAERAIRQYKAAAVTVVEVDTGRVLALVSKPAYDSNVMSGRLTRAEHALMVADPRKPFLDKTRQQHYPPGSTFKFIAAVTALESGDVDQDEKLECVGEHQVGKRTFGCTSSHGKVNMSEALQRSCNVYFWKLAERIGLDRMARVAKDFGFASRTGVGGDVAGRIPTRQWYEQRTSFKVGYTLNAATGQGDVEVTVLQLAMAYAAMANGGKLYVPQVVRRVVTAGGRPVFDFKPQFRRVSASRETFELIAHGMYRVVNEVGGTAHKYAFSERVTYAGKTGTAQVRGKKRRIEFAGWHPDHDHAWFAGYAPAKQPEIAVVVLIEHGGPGGKVAAPVARRIIEGYFDRVKPRRAARLKKARQAKKDKKAKKAKKDKKDKKDRPSDQDKKAVLTDPGKKSSQ